MKKSFYLPYRRRKEMREIREKGRMGRILHLWAGKVHRDQLVLFFFLS